MARYTGPVCRLCRREAVKLHLKGERCFGPKCPVDKGAGPPGMRAGKGPMRRSKPTEYALQLREKQKARRIYGVMERQFRRYYQRAARAKGVTGSLLLQLLERRLDNVVYRLGLATSRREARQLVRHGHFLVNEVNVNIPSYLVREGDAIAIRPKSRESRRIKELLEGAANRGTVPPWLEWDAPQGRGRVLRSPEREDIVVPVEERMVVEKYSR
ncbi:MAG: 30S ribosomal protein S4 [bacterium]|nr:30S ribosomal protein S4 [bacterium]